MFKLLNFTQIFRRLTGSEAAEHNEPEVSATPKAIIVRATTSDIPFIIEAYRSAMEAEAVVQIPRLPKFVRRGVEVSNRLRSHDLHAHPFVEGQPPTMPIDDIFLFGVGDARVGVLWLRNYNDDHLSFETIGEIYLLWIRPEFRGKGYWPQLDNFCRAWAVGARRTMLVGRCLRPSRRMAELFQRSGYEHLVTKPSGMSVHAWRISCRNVG